MTFNKFLFLAAIVFCCSCVSAEKPSLEALLDETRTAVNHAKEHLQHMLELPNHKDHQKVVDTVKKACEHFITELESHSNELHTQASGNHSSALGQAANHAAEQFNISANALRGVDGSDLKQQNVEYFKAADVVLEETKKVIEANPCNVVAPIVRGALTELKQDTDHYQDVVHSAVGDHAPVAGSQHEHGHHEHSHDHTKDADFSHKTSGHHAHANHHHVHGKSSEESSEEKKN
uniref:Protein TsetseEP domain-containing protein n=1 Tax=Clastoptera arizonana TaxID=38151 RepID=A0A1B6EH80_9HEMI